MITGSARQQDVARTLLSELGGAVAFEKYRLLTLRFLRKAESRALV
jgi:hypothetical protein